MITAMTKISLTLIRFEYKITFNRIKTENDLFAKIKKSYSVIFFSDKYQNNKNTLHKIEFKACNSLLISQKIICTLFLSGNLTILESLILF